ncbi:glyoxal reductase [Halolactibacillus alkaliphilus]|uniref:Glyoxal reductase n=1 Tax=Halolactibacillus alkaliphilus TaxID=442899 RepID=A0A511X3L0_9BACI|nr:aldo/keto reductase [Halolactibacillus alkaliphilus]GEN57536.1 glyoxal reductase [Halolactibacillus alkaliphilus]GGN73435.1 glyoxal reductase [Halolactibacillus alkaliphilus]SFO95838.1 Aldo/keto reductase [Halolactibacillus alkaliphilus]
MLKGLMSTTTLSNGVEMPWLGLGVFQVDDGQEVKQAVIDAIEAGYRSIDTASVYGNESGVGEAIKAVDVPREELFITSKLWNKDQGYESTLAAFEATRKRLDLDYLDLYLIHWPVPEADLYEDTWRAFEKLYQEKKVRAIGVSNFKEEHLQQLIKSSKVTPMVNQVEFHPHLTQEPLRDFCRQYNIQVEAWSPLKQGQLFDNDVLKKIAAPHNKTVAQVLIRWDLQSGVVTIPKSTKIHRIKENAAIFDFELSQEEMQTINRLNKNERVGPDPSTFNKR